ncbi:hypothetical protein HZQ90_09310 [Elizabethkingia anophelis]|nr:hypothetical protein [Elizabethkingia anophelis]
MLDQDFVYTLLLTGKLALVPTTILIIIGIPAAYWITYSRFKLKFIVEALICMPMVLPPTVMGYYLLVAFSPDNAFGQFLEQYFDVRLAFSFNGNDLFITDKNSLFFTLFENIGNDSNMKILLES